MSNAAGIAATLAALRQVVVEAPLRAAKATSLAGAIAYRPNPQQQVLFEAALQAGTIKATLDGRLWLDTGRGRFGGVTAIAAVCGAMVLTLVLVAAALLLR